jgi:rhodanese-related sulfurtransferase
MTDEVQCREASPDECLRIMEEIPDCRILDVRTPDEFRQGHLTGAENIDFYDPGFRERLSKLDRDRPYVVYCKKGMRGAKAMEILRQVGFSRVYNIAGGYDGWCAKGMPVQR